MKKLQKHADPQIMNMLITRFLFCVALLLFLAIVSSAYAQFDMSVMSWRETLIIPLTGGQ